MLKVHDKFIGFIKNKILLFSANKIFDEDKKLIPINKENKP